MGKHLDLDDVADGRPLAEAELKALRAENERLRRALEKIAGAHPGDAYAWAERAIADARAALAGETKPQEPPGDPLPPR